MSRTKMCHLLFFFFLFFFIWGLCATHNITLVYTQETKQHSTGTRISKWTCQELETQRSDWDRRTSNLAQGLEPEVCVDGSCLQDLRSRFSSLSLGAVVPDASPAPERIRSWPWRASPGSCPKLADRVWTQRWNLFFQEEIPGKAEVTLGIKLKGGQRGLQACESLGCDIGRWDASSDML